MEELGPGPYHASQIRQALEDPSFRQRNIDISDRHAASSPDRDHYPIVLVKDQGDHYTLLDGNRRTLRAILQGRSSVPAYVGTTKAYHEIRNYWVSTPFLRNLVRIAETADNPEVTTGVRAILRQLFAETNIAEVNYRMRVCSQSKLAQTLYDELI